MAIRPPLSDEQKLNLMRYGACRTCGSPREYTRIEAVTDFGRAIVSTFLTCPNGHPQ